jgi:hypothetical protein
MIAGTTNRCVAGLALAALVALISPPAAAQASPVAASTAPTPVPALSRWEVNETSSPLTHAVSISAALDSTRPLINMIGAAENASLILRCSDRVLVLYVNWPEVVNRDGENFAGLPKTLAFWRIDDGKIQSNFWTISDTGTAAGEFGTRGAAKLLATFVHAHQLVVRLSGRMTQDAVFDLAGISEIAPKVAGACGVAFTG